MFWWVGRAVEGARLEYVFSIISGLGFESLTHRILSTLHFYRMITTSAVLVHKYDSPSGEVSFVLFQPEQTFQFQEGQFCMIEASFWTWTAMIKKTHKKPYSIATTNTQLQEEKQIWFIVKKTSEDGMSDFLTQKIQLWDTVTLKWPVGHYVDPHVYNNYLLISIWSWLSPNFWLFQHLAFLSTKKANIINLVGEKDTQAHIPEVMSRFEESTQANVENFFCLSQQQECNTPYYYGRVQTKIADAITQLWVATTCFICWSPQAVQECSALLISLWVNKEDIITEKR